MVAVPPTDQRLATLNQIGVRHLVHYDMRNTSNKYEDLEAFIARARRFSLEVPVVESGPPIDRIVLGGEGWKEQTREWIAWLPRLATLGVKVICYNFMPQLTGDAMVVRTDMTVRTRGGAITTAYRAADLAQNSPSWLPESVVSFEELQENLRRFLVSVVPVAEASGVFLAVHPDDPPATPICGIHRVMSSLDSFDWLLELHSSPMNGVTLCAGCFAELGVDVPGLVRRFGKRIHFVHVRNIRGTPDNFIETFPDDGDLDVAALIQALHESRFDGYLRPDHAPLLATEEPGVEGYGFQGHLFTLGYLRGLLDATARSPVP